MAQNRYAVIYTGQLAQGVSQELAARKFAQLYRIDFDRAMELLSRRRLTLKQGLPENLARRYQKAFSEAGVVTQIQAQKPPNESGARQARAVEPEGEAPESAEPQRTTIMAVIDDDARTPGADRPGYAATTVQRATDLELAPRDEPVFGNPPRDARAAPGGAATVVMRVNENGFEEPPAGAKPSPAAKAPSPGPASEGSESDADGGRLPPDAAPPASTREARSTDPVSYAFLFHGQTGEYFRIWIVNLTLSILTLGIYSAWAKVRNLRYFYGSTEVAGGRFEFHGRPLSILIGRIIALAVFIAYSLGTQLLGVFALPFVVVLIVLAPWMINRSLAFRYRNTSFRGLRFGFSGDYMAALKAFVLWPLAGIVSFGLLLPYALLAQQRYIVSHASYGRSPFRIDLSAGAFYRVSLIALGIILLGAAAAALLGSVIPLLAPLAALPAYLLGYAYYQANSRNLVFNASNLEAHGFESSLETGSLAMLYLTNWLAVVFSLGLALPWARVRMARYRAEHLNLIAIGDLDAFLADQQQQVDAVGEELGDIFDLDLGL